MIEKQKAMNLLGLAQRAGKLETGEQFVLAAIRQEKAKLVLVASDASPGTTKKFIDKSSFYAAPLSRVLSAQELTTAIGAKRSLIAVMDAGFAKKLCQLLT